MVRATDLHADTTRIAIIYEQVITVKMDYRDIDFDEWIIGASTSYYILGVDVDYSLSGTLIDLNNGSYLLNISSTEIGYLGTFTIDIHIGKEHYQ